MKPPEKESYPCPPVSHEPYIQEIFDKLKAAQFKPFHLPLGIRLNEKDREASQCIRCDTCDGYPCLVHAKSDAHTTCVLPAVRTGKVTLITNAKALRLLPNEAATAIEEVEVERKGVIEKYNAKIFVSSCGAANSAALFLRSKHPKHPNGLANQNDQVGRHYMFHNNSVIIAVSDKLNPVIFQKTIGLNDFYYNAPHSDLPLGHMQLLGKVKKEMLEGDAPALTPGIAFGLGADHSVGCMADHF